jgi:hypothetical protein
MPSDSNSQMHIPLRNQGAVDSTTEERATLASTDSLFLNPPRVTEIKGWREYESLGALQWEKHRAIIKELYINKGKRLKDVIEIMKRDHGFNAT